MFLVCDGIGGENFGEEASRIACEEFSNYFVSHPPAEDILSKTEINLAQQHVLKQMKNFSLTHPNATRMGTTLTLVYIGLTHVSAAWCGDSRIYFFRNGKILWRSEDHSYVAALVKHGEITPEEARNHPKRNVITRSLSAYGNASEIDLYHIDDVRENDCLLLCTDGLLEQISEDILSEILLTQTDDKRSLFLHYANGKTKDNFSMYLIALNNL